MGPSGRVALPWRPHGGVPALLLGQNFLEPMKEPMICDEGSFVALGLLISTVALSIRSGLLETAFSIYSTSKVRTATVAIHRRMPIFTPLGGCGVTDSRTS